MSKASKTIVTVVLVFIYIIITAVLTGVREDSGAGKGSGMIGVILAIGLIFGIVAVWKYKPENQDGAGKDSDNDDKYQLDKH